MQCPILPVLRSQTPLCSLVQVHPLAPRLLINRDLVGLRDAPRGHGFRFHDSDNYRDVALLDDCDRAVAMMAEMLGWSDDLRALLELKIGRAHV